MTPFEKYGKLKVTGRDLTDMSGNVVQLKGYSSHGLSWYPEYVNKEFLTQIRDSWGAELFRLAMYTAEDDGYCVGDDDNREKLKKVVDDGVKYATELGMYVIVDWHILFDGNPQINKEQAKAFFAEVSAKYKDHENVIYELCNEPNPMNQPTEWADVKAYAEELIPIIRANDKDAVILVGTPIWSQRVDEAYANPVEDSTGCGNIMYVLHFYADSHKDDLRQLLKENHDKGLPIFVSEFGIVNAAGDGEPNFEEGTKWLDLLDAEKISYAIWNISNRDEASASFKPDCKKLSGFTDDELLEQMIWYKGRLTK